MSNAELDNLTTRAQRYAERLAVASIKKGTSSVLREISNVRRAEPWGTK